MTATGFVSPMLASPMPERFVVPAPGTWVAEEKFDGHRIVVAVGDYKTDLFSNRSVYAWSRHGVNRLLPLHVRESLALLPDGVYDGELVVPGVRLYVGHGEGRHASSAVTELANIDKLVYQVFDVIELLGTSAVEHPYSYRRALLREMFNGTPNLVPGVQLAQSTPVSSAIEVRMLAEGVWARGGEGLIVKRSASPYLPGKRTRDWVKVKQLRSAVLTVVGYLPGRGKVIDNGPHATVVLRDDQGCETTVKTLNMKELARLDANPKAYIGRKLRIEFQERTPDGGYRHPRWDRWEDE